MLDGFCEKLREMGFPIDSCAEDEDHFGNGIIKSQLKCGIPLTITKDRGSWECNISLALFLRTVEIPLDAVLYLQEGISFKFEELSFDSEDALIDWLFKHKSMIDQLSKDQIRQAKKKWDVFTNKRLKNRIG